jgi:bacterioferritin
MNEKIIQMLQEDMKGEHQAIIQYLRHAYAMGEVPMAFEIEAIAREEMRHLDWLADAIVELGGKPTMERAPVDFSPGSVEAQMLKDVGLEQEAIAQYRRHMEAIEDEELRLLLARIVHDEMAHQEKFAALAEEARREAEAAPATPVTQPTAPPSEKRKRLAEILNQGVRHEYTVTLQYLFHSFMAQSKELAEEMQNIAINEMQHMGWLAEAVEEIEAEPDMSHTELVLTDDPEEMLKADIAVEREVTQAYTSQLPEIEDENLQKLVTRIRDHEIYHDAVFSEFLTEVEEAEEAEEKKAEEPKATPPAPPAPPSVGSLIDK